MGGDICCSHGNFFDGRCDECKAEGKTFRLSVRNGTIKCPICDKNCFGDVINKLPKIDDVGMALSAIGAMKDGNIVDDERNCQCDYDVGMFPCEYCAIYKVLAPLFRVLSEQEAANAESPPIEAP